MLLYISDALNCPNQSSKHPFPLTVCRVCVCGGAISIAFSPFMALSQQKFVLYRLFTLINRKLCAVATLNLKLIQPVGVRKGFGLNVVTEYLQLPFSLQTLLIFSSIMWPWSLWSLFSSFIGPFNALSFPRFQSFKLPFHHLDRWAKESGSGGRVAA